MAYTVSGSSVITDSSDGILNTIQLSPTTRPPVTTRKLYDSDGTLLYNGALIGSAPTAPSFQYFTAPGTYTATAGVVGIRVSVTGAGGGSSAGINPNDAAITPARTGGGGGSAVLLVSADSATSSPFAVTIGTGATSYPGTGGTSSFGSLVSATGGGPAAGTGSGGDINIPGGSARFIEGIGSGNATGAGANAGLGGYYGQAAGIVGTGSPGIVIVEEFF